jgi:hypothetical protein
MAHGSFAIDQAVMFIAAPVLAPPKRLLPKACGIATSRKKLLP